MTDKPKSLYDAIAQAFPKEQAPGPLYLPVGDRLIDLREIPAYVESLKADLAARDARMKSKGKVEALEQLKERGHDPRYVHEEWVSMTDIQHWLEAARKEAQL